MNDQLIWFFKNSKVYKRTRSLLLRLNGPGKLDITPVHLFLSQFKGGTLGRFDVVVRYMAIEELKGLSSGGMELYNKMQLSRNQHLASKNQSILKEDLHSNKKTTLNQLVESFEMDGFKNEFPISVTPDYELIDGSHRLACALFFKTDKISVEKKYGSAVDFSSTWFKEYFSEDELSRIKIKAKEILDSIDLKVVLRDILKSDEQTFGRGEFYQSCEEIGLPGQRPTTVRYEIYELDKYLSASQEVLDIGCNCGFLTLKIAKKVRRAVGVEITDSLVEIGKVTQAYLDRTNATFISGNFNKMEFDRKFDFIFSFAVHHWLGADMRKFGEKLSTMLNPMGLVLVESQNIEKEDLDWEEKIENFKSSGFEEINSGNLKDDGVISRRFSLLRRLG